MTGRSLVRRSFCRQEYKRRREVDGERSETGGEKLARRVGNRAGDRRKGERVGEESEEEVWK